MWRHTIGYLAVNTVLSMVHTVLHKIVFAHVVEVLNVINKQSSVLLKPEWIPTDIGPFAVI